jgi:anti-sigma regulatory factor (Ser/Thr protein kinase)
MSSQTTSSSDQLANEVSLALPHDASGASLARSLVRGTLAGWDVPQLVDDAELAVSELVTNAYRHGLPPVVVTLRRHPASIRMDVTDARPATVSLELPIPSRDTDESGRGQSIIEAVSDHSGTEETSGSEPGKSSYASWDVDPVLPVVA